MDSGAAEPIYPTWIRLESITAFGLGLSLQLRDFAPKTYFVNTPHQTQNIIVVRITYGQLYSFLHDTETRHKTKRAQRGI